MPRYASTTRGVGRDLLERPLGDLDPVVERDHAVGDALDDVHVVLDHEDRVAALGAELLDQLRDLLRLFRVHPGGGLVEQEQARFGSGRARDLEPAAVRVGEAVGRLVPAVPHQPLAEECQPLLGERAISRSSRRMPGVRSIERSGPAFVCP